MIKEIKNHIDTLSIKELKNQLKELKKEMQRDLNRSSAYRLEKLYLKGRIKELMYLDYFNNFLTVSKFAEHYSITEKKAYKIIKLGRIINLQRT